MMRTFARKAHGNARRRGSLMVVESKTNKDAPKAAQAAPPIVRKSNGQPATAEDARRLAQLPRRRRKSLPKYVKTRVAKRVSELQKSHGFVSDEVLDMVEACALAWYAGKRAAVRAAETGAREDIGTMTQAFDLARALSKDAWSLCAFEAEAFKKATESSDPPHDVGEAIKREEARLKR